MKNHQAELKIQFPVDAKVITSFPVFWSYDFAITTDVSRWLRIGGVVGFTSTGGRMSYRDFSGAIESNQTVTSWSTAIQTAVLLNLNENLPFFFVCKTGVTSGRYDLDIMVELNGSKDSDNTAFRSVNLFLEPGIMVSKRFAQRLSANLTAGYNVNVDKGKQRLVSNSDLYLLDNSGEAVTLDWSGFRISFGVSIELN
ncbi:MAG: hypothetical protein RIB47_08925 [Cyclobacteriaceae bacterium]